MTQWTDEHAWERFEDLGIPHALANKKTREAVGRALLTLEARCKELETACDMESQCRAAAEAKVKALEQERDDAYALLRKTEPILDERDAALAAVERLREALAEYGEHTSSCIRTKWGGGRPTADGGYESYFAGKWYETKPVDRAPACTCGFDAALAAAPGEGVKEA